MLKKCLTGIKGLDELTNGGLPANRTTLVAGGPGCGKTVFGMEFLINGIRRNEPGVFMSFEENTENLTINFSSMGFNIPEYIKNNQLYIDYVNVSDNPVTESGDFSLDPLFLRLEYAIDQIGAKRVVLDTIETIFSALKNKNKLRSEIKRLFTWLHKKQVTAIITGEKGKKDFTRQGLEEYVSDCVILLDHRVVQQISKRRLRIVKYRGTEHVADECPFLITSSGFKVLPVTSLKLNHVASEERISTGVPDLDKMMENKGFIRATSILITGTSGTGKSSFSSSFAHKACSQGEKCLYFSFEESEGQIVRNMNSIGINLKPFLKNETLHILSERTSTLGLEEHLTKILHHIETIQPRVIIMDPISNFFTVGKGLEIKIMITRLLDYLKTKEITGYFTSLAEPDLSVERTNSAISSIMDTWLVLRDYYHENNKKRIFYLLKSRGMEHSLELKEMQLSDNGISLKNPDFPVTHDGTIIN